MHSTTLSLFAGILAITLAPDLFAQADERYDPDRALEISQAAVGGTIGDYAFTDRDGNTVRLREDYAGKPLVISMIFTSCYHVCPMTTKHLVNSVRAARDALGADSFEVVTIGFDVANDTPDAMRTFAREQGVDARGWKFLSATAETIEQISSDLGFIYFPTARGFDHLNQSTIVGRDGVVYRQIYGVTFKLPWLVEPMKELVLNRPESAGHFVASLFDRIRLFCTVYDASSGRYEFDNSLFFQMASGFTVVLGIIIYLFREIRYARRKRLL